MIGEVPKPRLVESRDVLVKVTGSTICGSDLHLLHGSIVELQKGDILGHEFCGVIEQLGTSVTGLEIGDRVVASFQIACGDVRYPFLSDLSHSVNSISVIIATRVCRLSAKRQTQTHLHTTCTAEGPPGSLVTAISQEDLLAARRSMLEFLMETSISSSCQITFRMRRDYTCQM